MKKRTRICKSRKLTLREQVESMTGQRDYFAKELATCETCVQQMKTDLTRKRQEEDIKMMQERTKLLSSIGQGIEAWSQAVRMTIGKEVM